MKVTVELELHELEEFIGWRKDKKTYDRETEKMADEMELMAKKILWAVEENPKKPGHYKVVDQDHLDEVVEMANEVFC